MSSQAEGARGPGAVSAPTEMISLTAFDLGADRASSVPLGECLNFVFQFMYILGICLIIELIGGVVALIFRNQVGLWRIYQPRVCRVPTMCEPWAVNWGCADSSLDNSILLGTWALRKETREQGNKTG